MFSQHWFLDRWWGLKWRGIPTLIPDSREYLQIPEKKIRLSPETGIPRAGTLSLNTKGKEIDGEIKRF